MTILVVNQPHKIAISDSIFIDDDCPLDAKGESKQGNALGELATNSKFELVVCKVADIVIGS